MKNRPFMSILAAVASLKLSPAATDVVSHLELMRPFPTIRRSKHGSSRRGRHNPAGSKLQRKAREGKLGGRR